MSYNNQTNGIFDIKKESGIVADMVVDALIHANLVEAIHNHRATNITVSKFLAFRDNQNDNSSYDAEYIKTESNKLAGAVVTALLEADIITQQDKPHAFEIAQEEILVRRSMERLYR